VAEKTRGRHFPYHPKLERLVSSGFDPAIRPLEMEMFRRNARDLRRWLVPADIRSAPSGSGVCSVRLPRGWELLLYYDEPGGPGVAGKVTAVFRPPEQEASPGQPTAFAPEPGSDDRRSLTEISAVG
jgi:hypothetical protein